MAEARVMLEWNQTSSLLAMVHGIMTGDRKSTPEKFNPVMQAKRRRSKKPEIGIEALKAFLPKGNRGNVKPKNRRS